MTYRKKGWVGWGDFLGTGNTATYDRVYMNFSDARKYVRSLKLKSSDDWKMYCKGLMSGKKSKPEGIPSDARRYYKKSKEWTDWNDWLGNSVKPKKRKKR